MFNPVFIRESRAMLRSWKTYAALVLYVAVLLIVAMFLINIYSNSYYGYDPQSSMYMYMTLGAFQIALVMLIVPAFTGGTISGERERQTLDLLIITRMSFFSIIIGKLMASLLIVVLMIIAATPVFSIVLYFGGISVANVLTTSLYTLIIAAFTGSVSIFLSTLTRKTIFSMVWVYIIVLIITLGNLFGLIIMSMLRYSMPLEFMSEALTKMYLSINPGIGFFSLMDTQFGTDIIVSAIRSTSGYSYSAFSSFTGIFSAIPMWVWNSIVNISLTALLIFLSARLLKTKNYK